MVAFDLVSFVCAKLAVLMHRIDNAIMMILFMMSDFNESEIMVRKRMALVVNN